jgi:GNAT superfamily N-acetyltransferase
MGWNTTSDLDKFLVAADAYLRARAAENIVLLSAVQDAVAGKRSRSGESLYGWWEPPDGTGPRGAFLHNPSLPLLIAGQAPEISAALAAPLARAGRVVSGVDAPTDAADAFAAAWSQRAGVAVKIHRSSQVYRLADTLHGLEGGPRGRARPATGADRLLLVEWLRAFGNEVGNLAVLPEASADDLLGYGGAVFWQADGKPVSMAIVTRPVAGVVRVNAVYSPPEHRGRGYAVAVIVAVSRAALIGRAREVVIITDRARPLRWATRLGFEMIGERAVLSFGPPTGPMPRLTGPLPRIR